MLYGFDLLGVQSQTIFVSMLYVSHKRTHKHIHSHLCTGKAGAVVVTLRLYVVVIFPHLLHSQQTHRKRNDLHSSSGKQVVIYRIALYNFFYHSCIFSQMQNFLKRTVNVEIIPIIVILRAVCGNNIQSCVCVCVAGPLHTHAHTHTHVRTLISYNESTD